MGETAFYVTVGTEFSYGHLNIANCPRQFQTKHPSQVLEVYLLDVNVLVAGRCPVSVVGAEVMGQCPPADQMCWTVALDTVAVGYVWEGGREGGT